MDVGPVGGHVAQGGLLVHDDSRLGRRATLPDTKNLDQQLNSGRPGKAEAAGEFEVPVTEDWKTKIGAKSALRQALPDCDQICNQIVMRSP